LSRKIAIASLVSCVLFAGIASALFGVLDFEPVLGASHDSIADLQSIPIGAVHLRGVVTYADPLRKRFWIQDDTGAIAIESPPNGIGAGQLADVQARKTHAYDPATGLASVALADFRVSAKTHRRPLPTPAPATLRNLPQKERSGTRVQLTAVIHSISKDEYGSPMIAVGELGYETWSQLPTNSTNLVINAKVVLTGVSEFRYQANGYIKAHQLWVQNSEDIQLVEDPPESAVTYSVQSLYRDAQALNGHAVTLRGYVTAENGAYGIIVEDSWGAVDCTFDDAGTVPIGSAVEVTGFPRTDGLRIQIIHTRLKVLPPGTLPRMQEEAESALTSIAAVRALTPEQANSAMPGRVTGVVTFIDTEWQQLFLQDSTAGIYVKFPGSGSPIVLGERLTVVGLTNAGGYAPTIVAPKLIPLGHARLPRPIAITAQDASSGALDSVFAEVEGIVHPLKDGQDPKHLSFDLYSAFGQVHISSAPNFGVIGDLRKIEDAKVRVRGVCSALFNSRRQLVGIQVSLMSMKDIKVIEAPDTAPFEKPTTPIDELLQFSPNARFNHRVKVTGAVTMVGAGFFYIQDKTGGLEVQGDTQGLRNSDLVEAVGYANPGAYSPILAEAKARVLKHDTASEVEAIASDSVAHGKYDSRLVTIDGRLLSVQTSASTKTLVMESNGRTFDAQLFLLDGSANLPGLEEGSILRLTGIASSQVDPKALFLVIVQDPKFRLIIRSPQDIKILKTGSWWNFRHTAVVLATLLTAVLASFVWVNMLRKRVLRQAAELKRATEKAKAVHDLTGAMQDVTLRKDFTAKDSDKTSRARSVTTRLWHCFISISTVSSWSMTVLGTASGTFYWAKLREGCGLGFVNLIRWRAWVAMNSPSY